MLPRRLSAALLALLLALILAGAPALAEAPTEDEKVFLSASELFRAGKPREAIDAVSPLLEGEGEWLRKARFLKARAHVELREFEAAETIYEEEARRLLSEARKREIAGLIVSFADALAKKPDPDDPGAPKPDFHKAVSLYRRALEMEIGRAQKDEVMFKVAVTLTKAKDHNGAVVGFRAYLAEFDPDWTGPVGSLQRRMNRKRENPPPAGTHVHEARFALAKSLLAGNQRDAARRNLEDLLTLLEGAPDDTLTADVRWQILMSYNQPPHPNDLEKGVKAARTFLAEHGADPRAVAAAWYIPAAYQARGRADQALAAYAEYLEFLLPASDATHKKHRDLAKSPLELLDEGRKLAVYRMGQIRFGQKEYARAAEIFERYVSSFPNGPNWADAQRGIIDAAYQAGVDLVAEKAYDDARAAFALFLSKYPLDPRARQILFTLGQIRYVAGVEKAKEDEAAAKPLFESAIAEWEQLVSKYPRTEESSLALYRVATIYEERTGNLEAALAAYRRLTWGSQAPRAKARIAAMTKKHLALETERKFRTNEKAVVKISVRNIPTLKVRLYTLDLAAFFRKTHTTAGAEALDVALIQPDRTWDVEVDGYAKYEPLEQEIEIPMPVGKPGVCLVNVSEEDFESTTLVVRSDLDLIVRTSRREVLVFAQDMLKDAPAPGVDLLLSDGEKVFVTGTTGDDGVYRGRFDELRDLRSVRVFATFDGNVASNALDLSGLKFATGLTAKGYVYTDRPAYRPGQTVHVRGIIRGVKDGSYVVSAGEEHVLAVTDAQGRLLWEQDVALSEFGTFAAEMELDGGASPGTYIVTTRSKGEPAQTFRGTFLVQHFQLQKMRLALSAPRGVYFRGEPVELTILSEYYWGEPVTGRDIRYWLPDGRSYVERPDPEGRLVVRFDTTGVAPGTTMTFRASIEGESVSASHRVLLAKTGFGLTVKPARDFVLSGEPFDVTVSARTAAGKPVAKDVSLFVLRRKVPKPDPVLVGVPWIQVPARPASEITVQEHPVVTDAKTGEGKVRLTLEDGGAYVLRVSAQDRFGQTVVAEGRVTLSDEEDATKLRFFAKSDTLRVGEEATLELHSRLAPRLALLTFDGEEILAHRVVRLEKGMNDVRLAVDHEHFPNFALNVAVLDGRELRTAGIPFRVERELKVTVTPLKDVYAPGAAGKVRIKAVDQLGHPVRAELSLALVDEALFALFPDRTPKILEFFQEGAVRFTDFRVVGTSGFRYVGRTRVVLKALLGEEERLKRLAAENADLQKMAELARSAADRLSSTARLAREPSDPEARGGVAGRWGRGRAGDRPRPKPGQPRGEKDAKGKAPDDGARRDLPEAGYWIASVVTGGDGTAEVDLPLPENTTEWRLTARGATVETLVGEATGKVVTRQDFFVEIKAPATVQERDRVRVLARVHNLGPYEGDADVVLTVKGGPEFDRVLFERNATVRVEKEATAEVLLDAFEIPAELALEIRVAARAGALFDAVVRRVPVRPWGVELADHGGGVAKSDAEVHLELPAGPVYGSRWLTVTVGPSVERAVLEMALSDAPPVVGCRPPRWGGHAASELLAATSALEYARAVGAPRVDLERIESRARAMIGALVVSQKPDYGWGWPSIRDRADLAVTCRAFWALSNAKRLGLAVNADTWNHAKTFLENAFRELRAADNDGKALIVHALSTAGAAEFAHLNRLYRERNALGETALGHTALAFASIGRTTFASEILDLLLQKVDRTKTGSRDLLSWQDEKTSAYYYFQRDRIETTALALLLMMEVRPDAPEIPAAVAFLLNRRGTYGFTPPKARGVAVAALAKYFGNGKYADTDARIEVKVNGQTVRTVESRADRPRPAPTHRPRPAPTHRPLLTFRVPAEQVPEGKVLVTFEKQGTGEYAYAATLRGFSSDLAKTPRTLGRVRSIRRHYYHANLRYRGRDIGVKSTSPVKNAEVGQRIRVYVDFHSKSTTGYWVTEEALPSGFTFVEGSLTGAEHFELQDGKLIVLVRPGVHPTDLQYELVAYATGNYPVLPTVIRDTMNPGACHIGKTSEIAVLSPGEASDDPYTMNLKEHFTLGHLHFGDGLYKEALEHLTAVRKQKRNYQERDVAQMLLWIHTSPGFYDAQGIVEVFEVLRERYPELEIPFDKILVVGRAYRDIGEAERAYLVFRATIDASFVSDAGVSAILEDSGQFLGSIEFQEELWREYPDSAEVVGAYFALSQALYQKAPFAHELADQERRMAEARGTETEGPKPDKISMLKETIRLLESFLRLYPEDPLADDAAFSIANAFLDLKQYEVVVKICRSFRKRFEDSDLVSGIQYMEALGHFWKQDYDLALESATAVGEGASKDRDFARYIVGQIYHAKGSPADAITWYTKVKEQYPDAREAIGYFEKKRISLDEVSIFEPGEAVSLELEYRNVKEAVLQVYRVDLMKLYLREKNLSNVTSVHLAGIQPKLEMTLGLGDGKDYVDKKRDVTLDLTEEAAYLVICRGDDLFASGLVLITPLRIEMQEDATSGRVRVNVLDRKAEGYAAEVHVKAIGSADKEFKSGETDLRGVFLADGLRGKATVIAREGDSRYAFYRGETWLGPPEQARVPQRAADASQRESLDFRENLRRQNDAIQQKNFQGYDKMRRQRQGGVQIQDAR